MAREIERKFLVKTNAWAPASPGVLFTQGYLNSAKERVVRVRLEGDRGTLTVKGVTTGISRMEFEYDIPSDDAVEILNALCERPLISKHRHVETHGALTWEIDVFHGDNEGLVLAEVELPDEHVHVALPAWAGDEVSDDPRYFNANLIAHPYSTWRRG